MWINLKYELPPDSGSFDFASKYVYVVFTRKHTLYGYLLDYGIGYMDWDGEQTYWNITDKQGKNVDNYIEVLGWMLIPEFDRKLLNKDGTRNTKDI